jgi:hypothetical protein
MQAAAVRFCPAAVFALSQSKGCDNERYHHPCLQRLQAAELHNDEKQAHDSAQAGAEEILSVLQGAHAA